MVSDEQVRWIALFFLFSSMDEAAAILASQKVVSQLKAHTGDQPVSNVALLAAIRRVWDLHLELAHKRRPVLSPEKAWILPDHIEIAPWVKFQKDASPEQVTAVVLSQLLGFSDQDIAEGFGLSIGTTRYRVSKGVRQLGAVMKATGY